jgi:single-strand DNA-binding protein
MNKIILKGRLTKEPELKYTQTSKPVVNISIAVDRKFGEETDFFNCIAWNGTAEFITKYFKKGQEILVEGRIENRKYEDKTYTEVQIEQVEFCGSKTSENKNTDDFIQEPTNISSDENFELPF